MLALALFARAVFTITALVIVGSGAAAAWGAGQYLLAIVAVVAFPITYFVYPWFGGLQLVFLVSVGAYALSTALGMRPID